MSGRLLPTPPVTPPVTPRVSPPESVPDLRSQTDTALATTTHTDASEPRLIKQEAPESPLAAMHDAAGSGSVDMPHTAPETRGLSDADHSDAVPITTAASNTAALPITTTAPTFSAMPISELKAAALIGDADAQFRLGNRFYLGRDVPQNYAEALTWYEKAAKQGHIKAQENLAYMYSDGEGVEKNDALALNWFQSAANQSSASAKYNLGVMYENGEGVRSNYAQAFNWYQKSATQAYPEAEYQLAVMYQNGLGVQEDQAMSHIYFSRAANQGVAAAQYELGLSYQYGRRLAGVNQDKDLAFNWFQKAADLGYAKAQTQLGYLYQSGEAKHRDYSLAASWYRMAADQGDLGGQAALADMYAKGLGVTQNDTTAMSWFIKAAEQGDKHSQGRLSDAYKAGVGMAKDLKLAVYWQLKCSLNDEGNELDASRLDYSSTGGMIEFIIQHLKDTPDFQNVTALKFPKNKFTDDDIAGISKLIRANLSLQFVKISSFESIGNINSRLLIEALKFNTQLTEFRLDSFVFSNDFEKEFAALLECNANIAELRLYVKEHPLIQTAGFPLELVSLLVDEMIVSSLRGGQTKEVTKETIDAVLLSASIKPLQEETKI